jgi:hypothetical protein
VFGEEFFNLLPAEDRPLSDRLLRLVEQQFKQGQSSAEMVFKNNQLKLKKFRKFLDGILEHLPFDGHVLHWLECLDFDFILSQFSSAYGFKASKEKPLSKEESLFVLIGKEIDSTNNPGLSLK